MTPWKTLLSGDGRGIIPQVRIWLLEREDLSERERFELVTAAVKAYRALKKVGQAPWEAWAQGYDPPELGSTIYLKEWIQVGANPVIPAVRSPIGERYFLRNNHGNRNPSKAKTAGRVFIIKHKLHAPLDVGLHAEQRLKMKAAREAWRELTDEQKEEWQHNSYALALHLPGHNAFVSFHMRGLI
jgi:hypothetical protein